MHTLDKVFHILRGQVNAVRALKNLGRSSMIHGHEFAFHAMGKPLDNMKILLLGPCAIMPLVDAGLRKSHRIDHVPMLVDDHRNTHFTLPSASASSGGYDANVITLPLRAVLANGAVDLCGFGNDIIWPRLALTDDIKTYLDGCVKSMAAVLESIRDVTECRPTFFLSFWQPRQNFMGNLFPRYGLSNPAYFVQELNREMSRLLDGYRNAHFVDVNEILDSLGRYRIQDDYARELSHASNMFDTDFEDDMKRLQAATPLSRIYGTGNQVVVFGDRLLERIVDNIKILRQDGQIKLIIVDLDDTLWRGVMADSSRSEFERIDYWPMGMAEALLIFKARGGMLAICSKNDEVLATAEFDRVWRGRLRLDDFVSVKINFEPKSKNVREILSEVNILPESAVFVDDNPREIDEVLSAVPGLRTLSAEHNDWRRAILLSPEMQVARVTSESTVRTQSVRAKIQRDEAKVGMSREEWLRSLNLEQTCHFVRSELDPRFARTAELINKTNQFNTNGKRWTDGEFRDHFARGGYFLTASLKDKTVDNGLIGVHVVKDDEILQSILSCRVFGLQSEFASGHVVCSHILSAFPAVRAHVEDTGRNFSCHGYYKQMGFTERGDGWFESRRAPESPSLLKTTVART